MRIFAVIVGLLFCADASAFVDCRLRQFATAAERDARADKDCTIGYAHDDDTFKLRTNGTWAAVSPGAGVTGAQGGTFENTTNNVWRFKEHTQPEDLLFTAGTNLWTISSATDATVAFTPDVAFATTLTLSDGLTLDQSANNKFTMTENSEILELTFGSNLITFDTSSSSAVFAFTPTTKFADKVYLSDDGYIDQSANNKIALTENSEDIEFTFASNSVTIDSTTSAVFTITPATTITGLTTATGGLTTTKPLFLYDSIRFCGNGSNGNTAWYIGSISKHNGADNTTGSAACDGNDGAAAVASVPMPYVTYKVVGMMCATEAGGADDTNTFKLQTDADAGGGGAAADVAGMTCSVTNDGSLPKTCSVTLAAPVSITAGAYMNIHNIQTDDNMSAKDVECLVYITY